MSGHFQLIKASKSIIPVSILWKYSTLYLHIDWNINRNRLELEAKFLAWNVTYWVSAFS